MRKPRQKPTDRSDGFVIQGYLQHWACFQCRKTFKGELSKRPLERLCPQCRTPMTNMGTDFKAPAQKNVKQWQKVRLLFQAGVKFFPQEGTQLPGERPDTLADVPVFLKKVYPPSAGERLLEPANSRNVVAPREGRLVQHDQFPTQTYSLLGKTVQSGEALEWFQDGQWLPIGFICRGNGYKPIPQPYALPRRADAVFDSGSPTFLSSQDRLRWPQQ